MPPKNQLQQVSPPVTNAVLHTVAAFVESDENIPKSASGPVLSPLIPVHTPVKNSSNVNLTSSPITTSSRPSGGALDERLESLERNITQLYSIITTSLTGKNATQTSTTTTEKMDEEKKDEIEEMFDDNDSVINPSPEREMLSEEIGTIISTNSLFEQETNVETYEQFKGKVSLNSTVHHPKQKAKKVGRPRKKACKLLII